jgi:2-keto-4-pentenoate hydratase/2-oxohepta-3-ene-1,7-dioic acid hydratase in catechol pathway
MGYDRRTFLKSAGALAVGQTLPREAAGQSRPRGLARGLTFVTVRRNGRDLLGVKTDRGILDVPQAAALLGMSAPSTLDDLLQNEDGPSVQSLVRAAQDSSKAAAAFIKEDAVTYGPLVSRPEKILCVGLNYRKHAAELGSPIPKAPVLFNKFNPSLNRHMGTVKLPTDLATQFDYECELVIVMGRLASRVSEADALAYVAGYATGNDFTARDLQYDTEINSGQWMIGKAIDQFAPLGPHLVSADQVNPDNLKIELRVNGQTRQNSTTSDMIFNTRQIISYSSRYFTLKPGDIIFTGTPEGVIRGMPKDKQVWLKGGDKIACSVEKLGELRFELV